MTAEFRAAIAEGVGRERLAVDDHATSTADIMTALTGHLAEIARTSGVTV